MVPKRNRQGTLSFFDRQNPLGNNKSLVLYETDSNNNISGFIIATKVVIDINWIFL